MAKTRRKKINGKAPLTRNSKLVLVKKGDFVIPGREVRGKPKGKATTGQLFTGLPVSKPYPYGSSRQGYGKAPRVETRSRPVLTVDGDTALHASR
jgi:hypothetical protein